MQRYDDRERWRGYDEDRERWGREYDRGRWSWEPDLGYERRGWSARAGDRGYDYERGPYERAGAGYGREGYGGRGYQREVYRPAPDRERGYYGREYPGGWGGYGREGYETEAGYERPGYYEEGYRGAYGREGYAGWGGWAGAERSRFMGRGPRGYQRSDERIREDVSDRLTDHPDIDASDIDVRVEGGVVTLSGMVDDRWQKRLAEDVAETVSGVRDVHNNLRLSGRTMGGRTTWGTAGTMGTYGRAQVSQTMEVVGSNGERIGQVKEVRDHDFLIDRPGNRDLYAPYSAIQTVSGDRVMLNVPADQVNNTDWARSGVAGMAGG